VPIILPGIGPVTVNIPLPGGTDLSGYKHYQNILEKCALPKEWE
jgi:hypothetical protein